MKDEMIILPGNNVSVRLGDIAEVKMTSSGVVFGMEIDAFVTIKMRDGTEHGIRCKQDDDRARHVKAEIDRLCGARPLLEATA